MVSLRADPVATAAEVPPETASVLFRSDYEWSMDVIRGRGLAERFTVLLSPVFDELDPRDLSKWILQDGLPVRLNIQLHKYIWGPQVAGV